MATKLHIDVIQFYLARGCELHPDLYETLLVNIYEMEYKGQICLTPMSIFEQYHRRLQKQA